MSTATFIEELSSDCLSFKLSELSPFELISSSADAPTLKRFLKVPIAPLGSWKHPVYGDVSFTQQDFDDILSNWQSKVVGYEPPLFLGHPQNAQTMEGAPSYAFLAEIKQEGDILYGFYEPIEMDTFELGDGGVKVKDKGVYRYSSAEIVVNAKSKHDGSSIGTLLVGTALTNRPFIPDLPRPQIVEHYAFSEAAASLTFIYGDTQAMTQQTTQEAAAPVAAQTPAADAELLQRITQLADVVTSQASQIDTLTSALSTATNRIQELEATNLRSTIATANVPAVVRETFSDLILSDSLSAEGRQKLLTSLQQLSDATAQQVTGASGDVAQSVEQAGGTSGEAPQMINPYAEIIEANRKLSEQAGHRAL